MEGGSWRMEGDLGPAGWKEIWVLPDGRRFGMEGDLEWKEIWDGRRFGREGDLGWNEIWYRRRFEMEGDLGWKEGPGGWKEIWVLPDGRRFGSCRMEGDLG